MDPRGCGPLVRTSPSGPSNTTGSWVAAFSRDESRILTWGRDGNVRLWAIGQNEPVQAFEHDRIEGVAFCRDENRILTWGNDDRAGLWAMGQNEPARAFKHEGRVLGAAFSRDASRILTWSVNAL